MRKARVWAMAALVAAAGCGGSDDGGDGGTGPAVFTTLSVLPASVAVTVNGTQPLTASAKDQNGSTMSGLTTTFTSANTSIARVTGAGVVTGVAVGTTSIAVTGTVGTVTKTATINVVVATPGQTAAVAATLDSKFEPATVVVTTGGVVTWTFAAQHNVTFDGSSPTGGNIPNTSSGSVQRTFPAVGTYNYHCTIHAGMNGVVQVQ